MRIKETKVYPFDELDDKAKDRAREWYREGALDYEWWDSTYDDAKTCLALAGFTVEEIYFSGFSSQGDGACFKGSWSAADTKPVKAMRQHAPKDKELHAIAATMRRIARKQPDAAMSVKQRGHYSHEHCTEFSVDARTPELEEQIIETSRDAMRWIYRQLEKEYEWLMSDEQVDESIRANEYEFTEEGKPA
jgi:hypothetical protein